MSQTKQDFASKAKGLTNNPLGIIGLFLVLVEGIASMVIATSKMNDYINMILVLFIVVFPFLVLRIFYLLVTKHHNKLYAPKDYSDEGNFVKTFTYDPSTKISINAEHIFNAEHIHMKEEVESNNNRIEELQVIKETITNIVNVQEEILKKVNKDQSLVKLEGEIKKNISDDLETIIKKRESQSFTIDVLEILNPSEFIYKAKQLGYKARSYKTEDSEYVDEVELLEQQSAIWLGYKIPYTVAIEVIRLAKEIFPHMKYVQLSNDGDGVPPEYVHSNIFIGGATKAAQRESLRELTDDEFATILKTENQDQLHRTIRSFYY